MKKKFLVIGSINRDTEIPVSRMPKTGETVLDEGKITYSAGGKGSNAAVALSRLGGNVSLCGRVGRDDAGEFMLAYYKRERVDTDFVETDDTAATGSAAVIRESGGANRIIVYPGANSGITKQQIDSAVSAGADALCLQFEIPFAAAAYAARRANAAGIPVIVDAAPAKAEYDLSHLGDVEIFSPNETETEILTGIFPDSEMNCINAAKVLRNRVNAKYILLKLGARGAYLYDGREGKAFPTIGTPAVDTTAAGDAFTAAVALAYIERGDITRAVGFGNIVGGITVARKGAADSIPTYAEVKVFISGMAKK